MNFLVGKCFSIRRLHVRLYHYYYYYYFLVRAFRLWTNFQLYILTLAYIFLHFFLKLPSETAISPLVARALAILFFGLLAVCPSCLLPSSSLLPLLSGM